MFLVALEMPKFVPMPSPEVARPLVRVEHGVQVLFPLLGARLDHPAVLEAKPHPRDLAPRDGRRNAEVDLTVRRVLYRPCEDLTARHVVLPIAVQEPAPLDGEREVRLRAHDPHLARLLQTLY